MRNYKLAAVAVGLSLAVTNVAHAQVDRESRPMVTKPAQTSKPLPTATADNGMAYADLDLLMHACQLQEVDGERLRFANATGNVTSRMTGILQSAGYSTSGSSNLPPQSAIDTAETQLCSEYTVPPGFDWHIKYSRTCSLEAGMMHVGGGTTVMTGTLRVRGCYESGDRAPLPMFSADARHTK